jgi:hypothetical protein
MSSDPLPQRKRYFPPGEAADPSAALLLRVLLAQDGSTTRLCAAICGAAPGLRVHTQDPAARVPGPAAALLSEAHCVERFSSLDGPRGVMMDNLVYADMTRIAGELHGDLEAARIPLGHLLDRLWVRREPLPREQALPLLERLWELSGEPDSEASRAYVVRSTAGVLFLIAETFRHGLRGWEAGAADGRPV